MKILNHNICKWFAIIAVPVIAIWSAIVIQNAFTEKQYLLQKNISATQSNNSHTSELVQREIAEIIENLKIVRDAVEFQDFLMAPTRENYEQASQLFVRIANNKSGYAQIRFIDSKGMEVIRVDNLNKAVITATDKLQNKADRYYFPNTIKLQHNEVYISPLDLNIEHGQIEQPAKPTLRFSTPLYGHNQQLLGILIINHQAQGFLDLLASHQDHEPFASFEFYILNRQGQYIAHPDPDKSFSFMYENGGDLSLQKDNQPLWDEMVASDLIGSRIEEQRVYSYFDVLAASNNSEQTDRQRWILLHAIDTSTLLSWKTLLGKLFLTSNVIIFVVILFLSLLLAYIIDRLILTDQQLEITRKIADSSNDAIVITDRETRITYANQAYQESTGFTLAELLGGKMARFQSGQQDRHFYQKMWQSINQLGHWQGMLWDKNKDGLLSLKKLKIIAVKNKKSDEVNKYVGIFSDMSAQGMNSDAFEMLKHRDGQVIIPNERMMIELLQQNIKNKDFSFTIIYLAIENFNRIISLLDQDAHRVSEVFISVIRPLINDGDVVAQTGRSRFAVIIASNNIDACGEQFVHEFHKELSRVRHIDGLDIFFKTRIGVSYWPDDTNDIKKLLLNSMIALEWTTRRQETDIAFFNEGMIAELNQENEIEGQLRKAVEHNELSMVYQPQIDIFSGQVIGMEALVRWHNKLLGQVSPMVFIPIAEKSNLMIEIGNWIIQAVCADIRKMKTDVHIAQKKLRCAINISAIQMEEVDFTKKFFAYVDSYNIDSHELEFEITESSLLSNEKKNIEILRAIRNKGLTVAIDDFGTGYSSLSYLHKLPIDKIKIDRSFIKNYPDCDDGKLAKILVEMAKTLQMKVLTEGAETKAQVDYLRTIGCDYIQGYYYSKPLSYPEFIAYLEAPPTAR